jgi:hypothetical protein
MNATDITSLLGLILVAWTLGFTAGYLFTKYKDAINDVLR